MCYTEPSDKGNSLLGKFYSWVLKPGPWTQNKIHLVVSTTPLLCGGPLLMASVASMKSHSEALFLSGHT